MDNLVQRAVTEDRQPQQGEHERNDQRADHKLTDGTPARNTRQEQADKRRPRHPPGPEEQGPVVHPFHRTIEGEAVERHAHKAIDVIADVEHQRIEQELGIAAEQHEQDQPQRQQHVELRQNTNALVDAGGHRNGGHNHRKQDQCALNRQVFRYLEQHLQSVVELHHANAERGGDAENGAQHRCDIHAVADRAVNAFTEDRVQRRTDGQRQVIAVAEITEGNAHQRIHRPAGQPIVEQRPHHGLSRRFQRLGIAFRRHHILRHGFGDREEHQIDADAGGEQHRRPAHQAELGFRLFRPELDRTEARGGDKHHEYDVQGGGQQVIPAEGG
ncbi:hypothetical protein D3C79_450080 [compost metagenome]